MNNKYSVACITLVRDKYKINTDGICVVYTADSIRKFDSKSNRTADSIRTQKTDSQVPTHVPPISWLDRDTRGLQPGGHVHKEAVHLLSLQPASITS